MSVEEIVNDVSIEELPGELRSIAEIIGVENTIKLAMSFRGCSIYIRNVDNILRVKRNNKIRDEYDNGKSVLSLARKYCLSTRQIQSILGSVD